ncbi:MAG: hypothetical protein F7B20_02320 [Aeropyrum sp.]|nr:hypothetical protein [Aeropyrum sp.]MCE4615806.1 hypothetical protein [Aeropyrum sp.]
MGKPGVYEVEFERPLAVVLVALEEVGINADVERVASILRSLGEGGKGGWALLIAYRLARDLERLEALISLARRGVSPRSEVFFEAKKMLLGRGEG